MDDCPMSSNIKHNRCTWEKDCKGIAKHTINEHFLCDIHISPALIRFVEWFSSGAYRRQPLILKSGSP